jgi:hypothetical protein
MGDIENQSFVREMNDIIYILIALGECAFAKNLTLKINLHVFIDFVRFISKIRIFASNEKLTPRAPVIR